MGSRGQADGALHSRTTENSIAAAKKANTRVRERIVIIMYHDAWQPIWQALNLSRDESIPTKPNQAFALLGSLSRLSSSNEVMPQRTEATITKTTEPYLEVGLICADRDGNRIRIDRVDRDAGTLSYHFLNDELRVQEGIQERSIEQFLAEGWYMAATGRSL
jgi:PleD family two-component response regulator